MVRMSQVSAFGIRDSAFGTPKRRRKRERRRSRVTKSRREAPSLAVGQPIETEAK